MKEAIKNKIPAIPHWRWVLYCALTDRSHEDINEGFRKAKRRLEDEHDSPLGAADLEDAEDQTVERAKKIRASKPPIRKLLEDMLRERCDYEWIKDAVEKKFGLYVDDQLIDHFKKYFWDVDRLDAYELARHEGHSSSPPVPGEMRDQYMAYQAGVAVQLNPDEVVNDVLTDAYFRSKELQRYGVQGDELVLKYQKNIFKAFDRIKESEAKQAVELPESIQMDVTYPDDTAVNADELEDYDPYEGATEEGEHNDEG